MTIEYTCEVDAEQQRKDRVVIAAAMAALFGQPGAISRMTAISGDADGAWVREGRSAIQTSHGTKAPLVRFAPERARGKE